MKYQYRKAMYLFEEEVILAGDDEPRFIIACVFEDGEAIDYDGYPITWIDIDWDKTNELWESQGKYTLRDCDFDANVRVDFVNGSWRLISEEEDADYDEDYEDEDDDYDDDDEDYDEDDEEDDDFDDEDE